MQWMNLSDGFPKKSSKFILQYVLVAEYYWENFILLKKLCPPQESFVSENLEGVPPKKFLTALPPPPEKI